jgi:hypothetical protein
MTDERGRGQVGMELIVGLSLIIMVFIIIMLIVGEKSSENAKIASLLDARRVGNSVKDNVNMIVQQGPGYYTYFSMPTALHGGYDYEVYLGGDALELMWADQTWSTKLLASNVTVWCLSKGLDVKNRVIFNEDGIVVTCHLPNLKVLRNTLSIKENPDGTNRTRVTVIDDSHVGSDSYRTRFQTNGSIQLANMPPLGPGESTIFEFNATLLDYMSIEVDDQDDVNESIESDNNISLSI